MDERHIDALTELLVNRHFQNKSKVQAKGSLEKYAKIMDSATSKLHCEINYSSDSRTALTSKIKNFLRTPNGRSPVILIEVDDRHDWIKLLRLIAKDNGKINAEAISLSGKGTANFNGFGHRYEHPEDKGDDHDFFHVQPIKVTDAGENIPGIQDWVSARFPTFFMFASSSYELILYTIHSLCGRKVLQEYYTKSRDSTNFVLKILIRTGEKAKQHFLAEFQNNTK